MLKEKTKCGYIPIKIYVEKYSVRHGISKNSRWGSCKGLSRHRNPNKSSWNCQKHRHQNAGKYSEVIATNWMLNHENGHLKTIGNLCDSFTFPGPSHLLPGLVPVLKITTCILERAKQTTLLKRIVARCLVLSGAPWRNDERCLSVSPNSLFSQYRKVTVQKTALQTL